ncbi:tetratricopeptide repeat (TPR)-containing protein isoform X2 [Wolffia australiana]
MRREEDVQLKAAKKGFRAAEAEGNREEEARWANVIGDVLKRRGEYVEALRWLRRDYEISTKHLPQKQLLPTCQSLGEVYFRLEQFKEALTYQKHLQIAKDSEDLIEQQRASTQLGRTYHEIFLKSEDDHYALQNAKKYFKTAMKLARTLKEKQSYSKCSQFLKEFIDAYNNLGMLEKDLDNLEEARKILLQGLKICDEEEVPENDDGRTRLHHNLGTVYLELRQWARAKEHIEKDISICKNIGHPEGEAKGFINLGELHYQMQNYEDAIHCYQKAIKIANSLQDEDALANLINQNIVTAKEAKEELEELKREELKLRKLARTVSDARGTGSERKYLLELYALLDRLIEKSHSISAWSKLQDFAKRKKKVADELCDKEKMSDSYLAIGESYQKLRNYSKARKWYMKSWNISRSIGNLEGQALAKINIGNVLDSAGDWAAALESFEEGYRLAVQGNFPSAQLSALENMHYSHMIRFNDVQQARKLQDDIQKLRRAVDNDDKLRNCGDEYCSETETEGEEISSRSPRPRRADKVNVDFPSQKDLPESKDSLSESSKELTKSSHSQQQARKRPRVIISDDEDEDEVATSNDNGMNRNRRPSDIPSGARGGESVCSLKSTSSKQSNGSEMDRCSLNGAEDFSAKLGLASDLSMDQRHKGSDLHPPDCVEKQPRNISVKVDTNLVNVNLSYCKEGDYMNADNLKALVSCTYYLHLPEEKRSKGLVPIIRGLEIFGRDLETVEISDEFTEHVSAAVEGWVPKRLMKSYVDYCQNQSEKPSMRLLIKLYNLEVSEDEVMVSDCGLQDVSISPLLEALQEHKSLAALDLSHNLLGNSTMEKLQKIFTHSSQRYGGLTFDLHCNQFGPTALFQICECGVLLSRLEVLNLSGNRLTDACSFYIGTILLNCKSLYSLNLEQTSITSRTIQKIADSLHEDSPISHLFVGRNSPISGTAAVNLMNKLSTLKRFSELSLRGIKLSKIMVDALCRLIQSSSLSSLDLAECGIRSESATRLLDALSLGSGELINLDLSFCGLLSRDLATICMNSSILGCVAELNLSGNPFGKEGCGILEKMLADPRCCVRVLNLDSCRLGFSGVVQILEAASGSEYLEELYLANNAEKQIANLAGGSPATADLTICETSSDRHTEDQAQEKIAGGSGTADEGSIWQTSSGGKIEDRRKMEEISAAIARLRVVDLSGNDLAEDDAEALFRRWRSPDLLRRRRAIGAVHCFFFSAGKPPRYLKPCCRRHGP